VKSGKHYIKYAKGFHQRWQCKLCGTTFCNEGYFRGKHPLALLQYASALYENGCSYEQIIDKIDGQFHQKVSRTTIGKWMKHLGVEPRLKSSGNQKDKIVRELLEIGVATTVRFASSEIPEKFLLLDNIVVKEVEVRG
jgi:transposase-like protein